MPSPGSSPTCHGQATVRTPKCLHWGNTSLYGERYSPVHPYPGRSVPFQCQASLKAKVHSRHQREDTRGQWGSGSDPEPSVVQLCLIHLAPLTQLPVDVLASAICAHLVCQALLQSGQHDQTEHHLSSTNPTAAEVTEPAPPVHRGPQVRGSCSLSEVLVDPATSTIKP